MTAPENSIKNGVYPSKVSGYKVEFNTGEHSYVGHCANGVRGFNIPDTVIVSDNGGMIVSSLLGKVTIDGLLMVISQKV